MDEELPPEIRNLNDTRPVEKKGVCHSDSGSRAKKAKNTDEKIAEKLQSLYYYRYALHLTRK